MACPFAVFPPRSFAFLRAHSPPRSSCTPSFVQRSRLALKTPDVIQGRATCTRTVQGGAAEGGTGVGEQTEVWPTLHTYPHVYRCSYIGSRKRGREGKRDTSAEQSRGTRGTSATLLGHIFLIAWHLRHPGHAHAAAVLHHKIHVR